MDRHLAASHKSVSIPRSSANEVGEMAHQHPDRAQEGLNEVVETTDDRLAWSSLTLCHERHLPTGSQ